MAVIYLKHPIHGAKVAISQAEADNDKENGWEEFDPTVSALTSVELTEDVDATINALQPRRRGRRPKELMQE